MKSLTTNRATRSSMLCLLALALTLFSSCDDENAFLTSGDMAALAFSVSADATTDGEAPAAKGASRSVHVMDAFELDGDTVYLAYVIDDIDAPADSLLAAYTGDSLVPRATRATPINGTNLDEQYVQFNVSAYLNGTLTTPLMESDGEGNAITDGKAYIDVPYVWEMNNDAISELWKTSSDGSFYWPSDRSTPVTFYAYAPTSYTTTSSSYTGKAKWAGLTPADNFKADGKIEFAYTVPTSATTPKTDAEYQPDILVSSLKIARSDSRITNKSDYCIAPITFYHALSAVDFKVSKTLKHTVALKSLTLKGLKASGTCKFTPLTSSAQRSADLVTWDYTGVTTNTGSYTQTYDYAVPATTPTTDNALGSADKTFMLLPQTFGTGGNSTAATVTIAFGDKGSTKEVGLHQDKKGDGTNVAWLPGKKYTYLLVGDLKDLSLKLGGALISWDKDNGTLLNRTYTLNVTNNDLTFDVPTGSRQHERSFSVQSYYVDADAPTSKQQLACTVEYSLDNGSTWTTFEDNSAKAPYFKCPNLRTLTQLSGTGTNLANVTPIRLSTDRTSRNTGTTQVRTLWAGHTPVGSNATPIDLSKTAIGGGTREGTTVNTANCYIVKEPGYYRLPLVYGNGIKGGNANTAAWKTSSTGTNVLGNFLNAAGRKVGYTFTSTSDATGTDSQTPYILQNIHNTPLSAFGLTGSTSVTDGLTGSSFTYLKASLVWCDAKQNDELLVQDVQLKKVGTTIGDCAQKSYLQFKTASAANLVQGNAVVALYIDSDADGIFDAGSDPVVWSWHIWVTDADLRAANAFTKTVNVTVGSTNVQHTFKYMRQDVGQCGGDQTLYCMDNASLKEFKLRITQAESGLVDYVTVRQPDVLIDKAPNAPYYQMGRKDPFCPKNDDTYDMSTVQTKTLYDPTGNTTPFAVDDGTLIPKPTRNSNNKEVIQENVNAYVAATIRHPHSFATGFGSSCGINVNMWDMASSQENIGETSYEHMLGTSTAKTIYDPCPYGYVTPPPTAFMLGSSPQWDIVSGSGFKPASTNTTAWYLEDASRHVLGHQEAGYDYSFILPKYGMRNNADGLINTVTWSRALARSNSFSATFYWGVSVNGNVVSADNLNRTPLGAGYVIRPVLEE